MNTRLLVSLILIVLTLSGVAVSYAATAAVSPVPESSPYRDHHGSTGGLAGDSDGNPVLSGIGQIFLGAGYVAARRRRGRESRNTEAESRERFEVAAQSLARFPHENPNPVLRVRGDGRIVYANAAAGELLAGFGLAGAKELPPSQLPAIRTALDTCRPHEVEMRAGERVYLFNFEPVPEEGAINVYGIEITGRVRAEEALRESERRLSTLMSNLPGLAYRRRNDRIWTMLFISEGCHALTGYTPADLVQNRCRAFGDLIHPGDRVRVTEEIQAAVREDTQFKVAFRLVTASGEEKWVSEQGQAVRSSKGEVVALEGFISDITEQKRYEAALKSSEERFKIIFEFAPDAVYIHDQEGRFVDGNRAAEELIGRTREDLIGKRFFDLDLLSPADFKRAVSLLEKSRCGIATGPDELVLKRPDGTAISVEIMTYPISIEGQQLILGIARDVAERKELDLVRREAFRQIDRNLEQLAILNDEIRNPLQVIVALAGMDGGDLAGKVLTQAYEIDGIITELDRGWLESEKVREYLRKHYGVEEQAPPG